MSSEACLKIFTWSMSRPTRATKILKCEQIAQYNQRLKKMEIWADFVVRRPHTRNDSNRPFYLWCVSSFGRCVEAQIIARTYTFWISYYYNCRFIIIIAVLF